MTVPAHDRTTPDSPELGDVAGTKLFVRNATGFVREVGFWQAFVINISVLNPAVGLVVITGALAVFPGTDLTWPLIIAAVLVGLLVYVYAQLVSSMPRTGGDFVFISRIVSPAVGAMAGGALLLSFMFTGGWNTGILTQQYLPFGFEALGSAFHSSGLTNFGTTIATKNPSFIVSLVIIALLLLLALRSTRLLTRLIFWSISLAGVGYLVVVIEFLTHGHTDLVRAFNQFSANKAAFPGVIRTAHQLGGPTAVTVSAVIAAIPFAAFGYWGFTWSIYPSGEVKRPMRTTKLSTFSALAVGLVMYLVGWLALKHIAGLPFLQAANWLQANHPASYSHLTAAPTTVTFYALLLSGDPITKILMGIAFPAASLAIIGAYILVLSRVTFALSFDRLLPTVMSDVSAKRHVPRNAYLLSSAGFVIFVALSIYSSWLTVFRDLTLLAAINFVLVSLAATLLPWVKRDLYESSPRAIRGTWLGLPPITIIGGLSVIVNAWMAYAVVTEPQIVGGYSLGSVLALIIVFGWGIAAYGIVRYRTTRRGIGLGLATRTLPPE